MPARVYLTVPPGFRKKVPPGCALYKATLAPDDVESRIGYQVTTPLRTLLYVADSPLSQEHLNKATRDVLERGLARRRLLETGPCSPEARRRLDQALVTVRQEAAEWNLPSETENAPQGLILAPEGAFQLQPGISNPWL